MTDYAANSNTNNKATSTYHAHFDCFSGAAGDMMLASCIDASSSLSWSPNELLSKIEHDLKKGIPELEHEFQLKCFRVWRGGMGSIAALKVEVESIYGHKPAPVPSSSNNSSSSSVRRNDENSTDNNDAAVSGAAATTITISSHEHSHEHEHEHEHDHEHSHEHKHSHEHEHEHEHDGHGESNGHSHEHSHEHSHGHSHGYAHYHSQNDSKSSFSSGPLRNLPQIKQMLLRSSEQYIPVSVAKLAIQTFTELAIAESCTHGTSSPDRVHFHEVGAIDSIVDVIGTLLALHYLKVETVSCSRLPMGEGTVWTDHGQLPVPAFATMRLMMGMKTCPGPGNSSSKGGRGTTDGSTVTGELVTPTAAALLRVLTGVADAERSKQPDIMAQVRVGRPPSFTPRAIGLGAGTKDFVKFPNVVRLVIGDDLVLPHDGSRGNDNHVTTALQIDPNNTSMQVVDHTPTERPYSIISVTTNTVTSPSFEKSTQQPINKKWNTDNLTLLQANIDDITAEVLSHAMDLLLTNGAVDAWVEPIVMKKGRSAHCLNCLYHSNSSDLGSKLMEIIFCHTTTLGIRIQRNIERASLDRKLLLVHTKYGHVNVKVGYMEGKLVSVKAEYEDCKKICNATGIPIKIIADVAVQTFHQEQNQN